MAEDKETQKEVKFLHYTQTCKIATLEDHDKLYICNVRPWPTAKMYIQRYKSQNTIDNQSRILANFQVTYKKTGKENRKMKNKKRQIKQNKMAYLSLTASIVKCRVSVYTN